MTGNFRLYTLRLLLLVTVAVSATAVQAASDTENRIAQLERISGAHSQVLTGLQQQVADNQSDIDTLRGQIQESQYQLNQVIERQKQILLQLDSMNSTASSGANNSATPVTPATPPTTTTATPATTATPTTEQPASQAASDTGGQKAGNENADYQAAVALIAEALLNDKAHNQQAIAAFQAFASQYPKSKHLPNALYWLGYLNYQQKKQADALYYFAKVAKEYPKTSKAAESLYKVGVILQSQGKKAQAKAIYNQVIQQYPRAEAAKQAKINLKKL